VLRFVAFIGINFAVVTVANGYYVFLKLNATPSFQLTISAFKVVWNGLCAPALSRFLLRPRTSYAMVELVVSLCNTIVIPVLATIFVSPDCFNHAFVQQNEIQVSYTSDLCMAQGASGCAQDMETTDFISFHPPYLYNYQCSYAFTEIYAPAYVYVCLFATFGIPLLEIVLVRLHSAATPGTRWFAVIDTVIPRILKPPFPDSASATTATTSAVGAVQQPQRNLMRPYFDASQGAVTQLTYLALLMTLGVVFPPLAAAIVLTMVVTTLEMRVKIGRFLSAAAGVSAEHSSVCAAVLESECSGVASKPTLRGAMWAIFTVSGVFYGLFLFDTLGVNTSFREAFWVLFAFPASTLLWYGAFMALHRWYPAWVGDGGDRGAGEERPSGFETKARLESGSTTIRTISAMRVEQGEQGGGSQQEDTFNVLSGQL
jgi:hypothetical protein